MTFDLAGEVHALVLTLCVLSSMMAVRSGAERVYAVEVDDTMAGISQDILASNGMVGRIKLFHSHSTSLAIPTHLPQRYIWCSFE